VNSELHGGGFAPRHLNRCAEKLKVDIKSYERTESMSKLCD
jgi:hypothetical protein